MKPKYRVGTTYTTRGKHPKLCKVVDILQTYSERDGYEEPVKIRYVSEHEFCGQIVTDSDVCEATIAMGNPQNVTDECTCKEGYHSDECLVHNF